MIEPPKVERVGPNCVLSMRQTLPVAREALFPFFTDARNLERITPPFLRFRVLTEGSIDMRVGTLIDYRIKLHSMPVRWRTEITGWEPPGGFRDEQRRGPYRLWRHTHWFTPTDDGGTLCEDRVEYRVPGGPVAPLVDRFFVRRDVVSIFRYRAEQLAEIFPPAVEGGADESLRPEVVA